MLPLNSLGDRSWSLTASVTLAFLGLWPHRSTLFLSSLGCVVVYLLHIISPLVASVPASLHLVRTPVITQVKGHLSQV